MYAPDQAPYLESDGAVVDIDNPDLGKFPDYERARVTYEFALEPGEMVYVPHGWYHTARSASDSVSLTWNFVHRAGISTFRTWLDKGRSKIDNDIIRFFFAPALGSEVTTAAIVFLLAEHFSG